MQFNSFVLLLQRTPKAGETNGGLDSLLKHIDDNPRKWSSVSKAADDIHKEKDSLIEK